MFCPVFVWIVKSLDYGITENVQRKIREVTERVNDRPDHVVIKLNLRKNLLKVENKFFYFGEL